MKKETYQNKIDKSVNKDKKCPKCGNRLIYLKGLGDCCDMCKTQVAFPKQYIDKHED